MDEMEVEFSQYFKIRGHAFFSISFVSEEENSVESFHRRLSVTTRSIPRSGNQNLFNGFKRTENETG